MQGEIYSYSRSKGVFAGVSLKGTSITPDANRTYFGKPLTAKTILLSNWSVSIPESGVRFMETLNRFPPLPPMVTYTVYMTYSFNLAHTFLLEDKRPSPKPNS